MVVILFFCTPELSSLLKQVTSDYVHNDFLIASKALDGGGGKFPWTKNVLLKHSCWKQLLHPTFQETYLKANSVV